MSNLSPAKLPGKREVIIVDSDSDGDATMHSSKRARTDAVGSVAKPASELAPMSASNLASKNTHLKGRKRFKADLEDARNACQHGFPIQSMQIYKLHAGDDEGQIEFQVHSSGTCLVRASFLISDTSEYPSSHTFYAFSPDSTLSPKYKEIIEDVSSYPSLPIMAAIERMVAKLTKSQAPPTPQTRPLSPQTNDDEEPAEDDSEDDGYYEYDDLDASQSFGSTVKGDILQRDFIEIVASDYRPGIIRIGSNEFLVTVSVPVISLVGSIPPRALMTWDRRLLSSSQHLTLLISGFNGVYPALKDDGAKSNIAESKASKLKFSVGLCPQYKPGKEQTREACRNFGLVVEEAEDKLELPATNPMSYDYTEMDDDANASMDIVQEEIEPEDPDRFDKFALSSSLESLMNHSFLRLIYLRRNISVKGHKRLGWAAAETLLALSEKAQESPHRILENKAMLDQVLAADRHEEKLSRSNPLPLDPLRDLPVGDHINLPFTAFCYLVRRLSLCTRFCTVCHNAIDAEYEVLRPYVCSSTLCGYQYYVMGWGPSLEYEVLHNTVVVDLLVSLAYTSARENVLSDPLPIGLGLRVPPPDADKMALVRKTILVAPNPMAMPGATTPVAPPEKSQPVVVDEDGLCEFDKLDVWQMRVVIAELITLLPSIKDMKKHLTRKTRSSKAKPTLHNMDPNIPKAAWTLLRWCVASCTADLEELVEEDDLVQNVDGVFRQFRFSVGAPDAEAKFKAAVIEAQKTDANCKQYPIIYAFHGSPLRNWHSIIRHGLWFKEVTHGRAYGHGVYFAKDGNLSMGSYAQQSSQIWKNSDLGPTSCTALTEIVNLPSKFVSSNPHLVVQHTDWLLCRYLIVRCSGPSGQAQAGKATTGTSGIPLVKLDPHMQLQIGSAKIAIPEPSHKLEMLVKARTREFVEENYDADDDDVFQGKAWAASQPPTRKGTLERPIEIDDDEDIDMIGVNWASGSGQGQTSAGTSALTSKSTTVTRPADDWKHDPNWLAECSSHLMPPPEESSIGAVSTLQKLLKEMLKEQNKAKSYKELGWYLPPDSIGDNLFQWIVELHSFDPDLPVANDMRQHCVNSLVFEIRFPPNFPMSPPFFRIIKPRFLPFIHGGGGHVTGGGSMCMDLLTADGWLPSYSIPSILLQIKLAISNLDPRPARLWTQCWNKPYTMGEALEGFKRAAATHGWKVPDGLERLVR